MRRKLVRITSFLVTIVTVITVSLSAVVAPIHSETLQEQLDRLEKELQAIQNEKDGIQSQIDNNSYLLQGYNARISQLYGEIQIFQKDIETLELQIKELEVSIDLLDEEILKKQDEIKQSEEEVAKLEDESSGRIRSNYYNFRLYGGDFEPSNIFDTDSINEYYKDSQYKELIQADTNRLMEELANLKAKLQREKADLDNKLVNIRKEREALDFKKVDLDRRKADLDQHIAAYYLEAQQVQNEINSSESKLAVFSEDEAKTRAEAERVRNELFSSYTPTYGGEYVVAGRIIGNEGCTGLCTGPHLHFSVQVNGGWQEPCSYLPGGAYGCGGGGPLNYPITQSAIYTSGFGNRCFDWGGTYYCDFHSGIDLAGPVNTPVFAAHNGYAYKGVDPYGALYVIVCEIQGCGYGIKTGYWHLNAY